MNGDYVSGGARLSFSDAGEGLPVVLLHPTPLDREYWRLLTRELAGIRAIVPDLRGHGRSELGSGLPAGAFTRVPGAPVLTMGQLAMDSLALLDHLKISKAVFGGCSIGGYVLLELWRRAPERMRGMMFVCSKPQPDSEANLTKRMETIARARADGVEALFDGMAQNTVAPSVRRDRPEVVTEVARADDADSRSASCSAGGAGGAAGFGSHCGDNPRAGAGHCGRGRFERDGSGYGGFRAAPGGCELHVLPCAGHYAAYEQPKKVAALMAPWLRQFGD